MSQFTEVHSTPVFTGRTWFLILPIPGSLLVTLKAKLQFPELKTLINRIIRLKEIGYEEGKSYLPNIEQLNYFIDDELFGIDPVITTYFYDPKYKIDWNKDHPCYDVVPSDYDTQDHYSIYWNRSKTGVILAKGFDNGYGNYILIGFEA